MRRPSTPFLGTAAEIAKDSHSEGELKLLFMKSGLSEYVPSDWYGKAQLVSGTIEAAMRAERRGDAGPAAEARKALREFVILVADRAAPQTAGIDRGSPFHKLREAARSDGYDLVVDYEESGSTPWDQNVAVAGVRLLPLDNPAAPVGDTVTALENELNRLGMTTALNCYEQAVANLVDQRFESCNGQLRAMFEAVAVDIATRQGFVSTRQGDGGAAIRFLIDQGHLPERDGGDFVKGLWSITHTNGPHPGTSDAGEAFFRLQSVTAVASYLIDRFAPRNP